jgi:hypothetical protein
MTEQNTVPIDPFVALGFENGGAAAVHYGIHNNSPVMYRLGAIGTITGSIVNYQYYSRNSSSFSETMTSFLPSGISTVVSFAWGESLTIATLSSIGITLASGTLLGGALVVAGGAALGYVTAAAVGEIIRAYQAGELTTGIVSPDYESLGMPVTPCFPANTSITLADGSAVPIETISVDDQVACTWHDGVKVAGGTLETGEEHIPVYHSPVTAPLTSGKVTRLFSNVTEEWITLVIPTGNVSGADGTGGKGSSRLLTATPGHTMLSEDGTWQRLCDMIDGSVVAFNSKGITEADGAEHYRPMGTVRLVQDDSSIVTAEAHIVRYSAATAHLFEETEMLVTRTEGGLACQHHYKKGWKTYNFEVAEHHNYIAGGIRVHNDSTYAHSMYPDAYFIGQGSNASYTIWGADANNIQADLTAYASNGTLLHYDGNSGVVALTNDWGVTTYTDRDGNSWTANFSGGNDGGGWGTPSGSGDAIGGMSSLSGTNFSIPGLPILIDLDGDGIEIAPMHQNMTLFDFDDDGFLERTAWVGSDDGLLKSPITIRLPVFLG